MAKSFLCWIALMGLQGAVSTAVAHADCVKTPSAAIQSNRAGVISSVSSDGKGYRVTGVRWDPILNQRWATVASCDHPEWPEFSLRTGGESVASRQAVERIREEDSSIVAAVAVVRAGDIVHLWWKEALLRIEVAGVAEESGGLGRSIRVRLLRRNTDDQSTEEQFIGIVRGRADVEMQP
jgi:predicted secreted hydrolase